MRIPTHDDFSAAIDRLSVLEGADGDDLATMRAVERDRQRALSGLRDRLLDYTYPLKDGRFVVLSAPAFITRRDVRAVVDWMRGILNQLVGKCPR